MNDPEFIDLIESDAIIFSYHARVRMFERGVSTDDIISFIREPEILEKYPDDDPCPSFLILGTIADIAYHVVLAHCKDHIRVITVYIPEPDKWIDNRVRRR